MVKTAAKQGSARQRRQSALQARIGELESGARTRLLKALSASHEALHELDETLARVTCEDWTVDGVRKRLGMLRARAENLRTSTLKRVGELPGTAVTALASGTRVPVRNLVRELERLTRLVEPRGNGKSSAGAEPPSAPGP